MSWPDLLNLIAEEAGGSVAAKIEDRARKEMGGVRLTISVKPVITKQIIDATAPGKPKEAARILGVHQSTIYRRLVR